MSCPMCYNRELPCDDGILYTVLHKHTLSNKYIRTEKKRFFAGVD